MEASKEETEGAVQDFALDVGAVSVLFGREEGGGGGRTQKSKVSNVNGNEIICAPTSPKTNQHRTTVTFRT